MADDKKADDDVVPTVDELATQKAIDRGDFIEEPEDKDLDDDNKDDDKGDADDVDDDDNDVGADEDGDTGDDDSGAESKDDDKADDANKDADRIPKARLDKSLRKNREQQDEIDKLKKQIENPKDKDDKGDDDAKSDDDKDAFDIEDNWEKYQDLMEDGDIADAKVLLKTIRKEERNEAREENAKMVQDAILKDKQETLKNNLQKTANTVALDLRDKHESLKDSKSEDYKSIMDWADYLEVQKGMTRAEALLGAEEKVFSVEKVDKPDKKDDKKDNGELSQRDILAKQKNMEDSEKQPPMAKKGASNRAVKTKKPSDMNEDEHEALTQAQKKALRGDDV